MEDFILLKVRYMRVAAYNKQLLGNTHDFILILFATCIYRVPVKSSFLRCSEDVKE